ncbi:MAG: hypothetical protein IBJ15_02095 [Alphaproteobacteria bacterium]|nr:hypothetical protein [Alphaproteobacteria bacterium]
MTAGKFGRDREIQQANNLTISQVGYPARPPDDVNSATHRTAEAEIKRNRHRASKAGAGAGIIDSAAAREIQKLMAARKSYWRPRRRYWHCRAFGRGSKCANSLIR